MTDRIDTDCLAVLAGISEAFPGWANIYVSPDERQSLVRVAICDGLDDDSKVVDAAIHVAYLLNEDDCRNVIAKTAAVMRDAMMETSNAA